MAKRIVIFGIGKIADVIQFFMREDSNMDVCAFTVDSAYLTSTTYNGLPVVPFEELSALYPPDQFSIFVALGYQEMNALREQKMKEAENLGYEIISYIHPASGVPKDLVYGRNCFIMNNVCIHPRVVLGDNVFVWSGAVIGHHSIVGPHTWITSAANISGNVSIGRNCFLAVGCTIGNSISVGDEVFIGACTLVVKSVESGKVIIRESDKPIKLNSKQFLKMTAFSSL